MANILNIETSTSTCSAALTSDGFILCHREEMEGRNHATLLSDFIKACLDHARDHEMKLDAVAVSIGPGSYTGLRIGLSEAKGLAYAMDIPLIGVDTLKLLATGTMFKCDIDPEALLVPMIDARRMEVYTAVYDMGLTELLAPTPMILDESSFNDYLEQGKILYFMGDGAEKASTVIKHPNARFVHGITPLATDMMPLSEMAHMRREFLDLAYSTPSYLKEFQATKPKKLF